MLLDQLTVVRQTFFAVELRFFGGLTVEETAEALNVSPETVMRDWKVARAWLYHQLSKPA
jgi:DNA-directed RNA polymerase specialized sigma24 family protein